ncbi:MAG: ABC-type antimicrobial peptide transport system, permease component, partial [uncultured Lysobacter sp.]
LQQAVRNADRTDPPADERDHRDHGVRRAVRRAQHDVFGGVGAHARDRHAARARLRPAAGDRVGDGRIPGARRHRRRDRCAARLCAVQRLQRVDAEPGLVHPGRVQFRGNAGTGDAGPDMGAADRFSRRPDARAARGAYPGDRGAARDV